MARGTARWCRALLWADSICRAGLALAASAGVVLRVDSFIQCGWTYRGHDPWAYGRVGDIPASRARILFVTSSFDRICLVDGESCQDGSGSSPSYRSLTSATLSFRPEGGFCCLPAAFPLQVTADSSTASPSRNDNRVRTVSTDAQGAILQAWRESGRIPTL